MKRLLSGMLALLVALSSSTGLFAAKKGDKDDKDDKGKKIKIGVTRHTSPG